MIFKEYKKLNLSQISDEILSYWDDNDIFRKSIEKSNDKNPFIFFDIAFLSCKVFLFPAMDPWSGTRIRI